jgi:hypothetical protein
LRLGVYGSWWGRTRSVVGQCGLGWVGRGHVCPTAHTAQCHLPGVGSPAVSCAGNHALSIPPPPPPRAPTMSLSCLCASWRGGRVIRRQPRGAGAMPALPPCPFPEASLWWASAFGGATPAWTPRHPGPASWSAPGKTASRRTVAHSRSCPSGTSCGTWPPTSCPAWRHLSRPAAAAAAAAAAAVAVTVAAVVAVTVAVAVRVRRRHRLAPPPWCLPLPMWWRRWCG